MNKLILLFFGLIITLISCDGRKTRNDALKESITKFKDSIKPTEVLKYIPQEYAEIETDTILKSGFKIKISSNTDMEHSILKKNFKESSVVKQFHRKNNVDLKVSYKDNLVFNQSINFEFLKKNDQLSKKIKREDLIIRSLSIDPKSLLTPKSEIYFYVTAYNPNEKLDYRFQLRIDNKGSYRLNGLLKGYPVEI